jgi:hypothetical protein
MKKRFLFSVLITALFAVMTTSVFSQELERAKCYNEYWGYVDKSSRKLVIPCQYENAKEFSENLAAVKSLLSYWGFIDETGKKVIPSIFQQAESFSEGLAAVKSNGKWGFIDKTGTYVIPFIFQRAKDFSEGLAGARLNGKWGFIEKVVGNKVIPFIYKDVGYFLGGYALVQYGKFWGAIDKNGTVIVPYIYNDAWSAHAAILRAVQEREKVDAQERKRMSTQTANPTTTNAYDIILLKNGDEIKAKVLETTDQQIKYKEFDFQSGPIRNINKSEVFQITYENGRREVFNQLTNRNISSSKQANVSDCVNKNAFGLDIGIGSDSKNFSSALGIRVMHHFSPYFGIDFFKINWITDVVTEGTLWRMKIQIMPGIRGNSPTFFKCMSVYGTFRIGYGMIVVDPLTGMFLGSRTDFAGLCLETELGLNLTRTVFIGFAYNYHQFFGSLLGYADHTFAFRIGFNFGK